MYHYIVKRKLLNSFKALNEGRYEVITKQFHKTKSTHWFSGENHPLSGLRTNIEDIYAWYERLALLMPDLVFIIEKVAISGPPWKTVAMLEWTDTLTDREGKVFSNPGVHVIQIAWGKVKSLAVFCDTKYLEGYFASLVKSGVKEAKMPPIITKS